LFAVNSNLIIVRRSKSQSKILDNYVLKLEFNIKMLSTEILDTVA